MKIHNFVKDSQAMAQNEEEAIRKRERKAKEHAQLKEEPGTGELTEEIEQTESKKKKSRKKEDQEVV